MNYPGGKNGAGTYQKIINLMPPHTVYIEPFLGSGAILRRKRPAALNIGIDLDVEAVRQVSAAIAGNFGEGAFNYGQPVPESLAGSGDDRGRGPIAIFRVGSDRKADSTISTPVGYFEFYCADAIQWLETFKFEGRELIYLDPPYLMETRRYWPLYQFEMSAAQHRRLLRLIRRLKCHVMISGYWSQMYARALDGWNSMRFMSMTRGGTPAEEWVWFNYPPPRELHDYRFLGNSFRERERIKRRIGRWKGKLTRMDAMERQALLGAIGEVWGGDSGSSRGK